MGVIFADDHPVFRIGMSPILLSTFKNTDILQIGDGKNFLKTCWTNCSLTFLW
jgi:hypothetical protein